MISDLDEHVGAILERLAKHGLVENTIVIFTSDNGTTHGSRDPRFGVGGVDSAFFNSTAGLRGFKGSVYEGGIRVPTIVRWPGRAAPGTTTDVPSYFPDWFPTLCEIAGAKPPADLDGVSLVSKLQNAVPSNPAWSRGKPMIWEFHGYGGQIAVMDGDWKAVRQGVKRKNPGPWELYHLREDRAESNNIAEEHPEIVERLEMAFKADRTPNARAKLPLYD